MKIRKDENIGPYKVLNFLGSGTSGDVYQVEKSNQVFALKLYKKNKATDFSNVLIQMRKEAAYVGRLKNKSVVAILDTGVFDSFPYTVNDFITGKTCEQILKEKNIFSEQDCHKMAFAIGLALSEMHGLQMIHRDIKPENIMQSDDKNYRLLDLGLTNDDTDNDQNSKHFAGTIFYSSPEQAGVLKGTVDSRSDLFSLGVTLFECCTGKKPINSANTSEFLVQLANERPPLIHEINPDVSVAFSLLVKKLIEKDPDDRYQTIESFISDLENIDLIQKKITAGESYSLAEKYKNRSKKSAIPLVGRVKEFETVSGIINFNQNNLARLVLISGESGSGKSRLADEVIDRAQSQNYIILSGKCTSVFSSALEFLKEAMDDFYHQITTVSEQKQKDYYALAQKAAGNDIEVLSNFCLGLTKLLNPHSNLKMTELKGQQEYMYKAVRTFILNFSLLVKGIVIKIDDIQWSDAETRLFIYEISKELTDKKVCVIMTSRNDAESTIIVNKVCSSILDKDLKIVNLAQLSEENVGELVREFLGGKKVHAKITDKIAAVSKGNAFVAGEYVRSLISSGNLYIENNCWVLNDQGFDELNVSTNVYDVILKRLSLLDENMNTLISYAAVAGNRFKNKSLIDICNFDEAAGLRIIQIAKENHFFETIDDSNVKFVHDKIREAIAGNLSIEKRKQICDDWVKYFEAKDSLEPLEVYDLAKFYAESNFENKIAKAFFANLKAGSLANQTYAFEQAYLFLTFCEKIYAQADQIESFDDKTKILYHEVYGNSSMHTGNLIKAHEQFPKALKLVSSDMDQAKFLFLISSVYAGEAKPVMAFNTVKQALKLLGHPYPQSKIRIVLSLFWMLFAVKFMTLTGLFCGYYSHPKRKKFTEKIKLIYNMYDVSFFSTYYQGNVFDIAQVNIRQHYYGHLLGEGPELAKGLMGSAVVYGLFTAKKISCWYKNKGYKIAEKIQNMEARAFLMHRDVFVTEFYGEKIAAEKLSQEAMPESKKYLGINLYTLTRLDHVYHYLWQGYTTKADDFFSEHSESMEKGGNHFAIVALRLMRIVLDTINGNPAHIQKNIKEFDEIFENIQDNVFAIGLKCILNIICDFENDDLNSTTDTRIKKLFSLGLEDYHFRNFYPWAIYAHVRMYEKSIGTPEAEDRRKLTLKSLWFCSLRAWVPITRTHTKVCWAAFYRIEKNYKKAARYLDEAERLADQVDGIWGLFSAVLERARLQRDLGNKTKSQIEAKAAINIAVEQKWVKRAQQVALEFRLESELHLVKSSASLRQNSTVMSQPSESKTTQQGKGLNDHRILDALLEISLASAESLDPKTQFQTVLDKILNVMFAERALVFLNNESTQELEFLIGRDIQKKSITNPHNFSTTAVNEIAKTKAPRIITGTDEMELLGSESAMASDLRSIMVAPLFFDGKFKGAIYVDSRVAKGLFAQQDVDVLTAIGNHILIGYENAKSAQREIEMKSLEKDSEISAMVQSFFLPKNNHFESEKFELAGISRPATQCGGDWWWYLPRGKKLYGAIGDVSGHGTGPAMITASVASFFNITAHTNENINIEELLKLTNLKLYELAKGKFSMSMFIFELDLENSKMKYWNAGHNFPIMMKKSGEAQTIGGNSSLLGCKDFVFDQGELDCVNVSRITFYTDGLTELKNKNKMFSERRLIKLLADNQQNNCQSVVNNLLTKADEFRAEYHQEDDITLLVLDLEKRVARAASKIAA